MSKIPTQGSQIYFNDKADTVVDEIGCALSINVGASTADKIDITCLADAVRTSMPGLKTLAEITIVGAVEDDDPVYPMLSQLALDKTVCSWYIGLSNGTTEPTVTTAGGPMVPPTDRSGYSFEGYVSSVSPQIEANNIVKYSLVIDPTTDLTYTAKAAGP